MSAIAAAQWTAIATVALAVFAVITAVLAGLAFLKESQEVKTLQQQVGDEKNLIKQQAELLRVQAEQLDVQRRQFDAQQDINTRQAELMELQAQELRESLDERHQEAQSRRATQASQVFIWIEHVHQPSVRPVLAASVVNSSSQAIYYVELHWYHGSPDMPYGPNPQALPPVMPGADTVRRREFDPGATIDNSGATLTFRDAAGVRWERRPDGTLTDLGDNQNQPDTSPPEQPISRSKDP